MPPIKILFYERRDTQQIAAIIEQGHDEPTDAGCQHGSSSAVQASSTNHNRCNYSRFTTFSCGKLPLSKGNSVEPPPEAAVELLGAVDTRDGDDLELHVDSRDTRVAGRVVTADHSSDLPFSFLYVSSRVA